MTMSGRELVGLLLMASVTMPPWFIAALRDPSQMAFAIGGIAVLAGFLAIIRY